MRNRLTLKAPYKLGRHRALRPQQGGLAAILSEPGQRHSLARHLPARLHADRPGRLRDLLHRLGAVLRRGLRPRGRVSTLSGLRNTVEPYLRLETCLFRPRDHIAVQNGQSRSAPGPAAPNCLQNASSVKSARSEPQGFRGPMPGSRTVSERRKVKRGFCRCWWPVPGER